MQLQSAGSEKRKLIVKDIVIRGQFITLGQLLKLVGEVSSGGDVKDYLAVETPIVNGEPEIRRGRKLRPGDVIELKHVGQLQLAGRSM
jgi:ribosome-associated protein